MSNPTSLALPGHRYLIRLDNGTTACMLGRVQNASVDWTVPTDVINQLGTIDPAGSVTDPIDPKVSLSLFLHSLEVEEVVTHGSGATTSFTLIDIINANSSSSGSGNCNLWVPFLSEGASYSTTASDMLGELAMGGLVVQNFAYAATIRGPMTESWNFQGRTLTEYTSGCATHGWGTLPSNKPAAVRARDIIISIGAPPSTNTGIIFRAQSVNIGVDMQVKPVSELGNTSMAGYMYGQPNVSFSFDVLETGTSPDDSFATLTAGNIDFNRVTASQAMYVSIYSETTSRAAFGSNEAATPIKSFKIHGVRQTRGNKRFVVNSEATKRYEFVVDNSSSNAGGLTIFRGAAS